MTIVTGLRHHMHRLAASLLLLNPLLGIAQAEKADLILLHGEVLSVDSHDTIAQAIAIRRGVILKTGSDAENRQPLAAYNFANRVPGLAGTARLQVSRATLATTCILIFPVRLSGRERRVSVSAAAAVLAEP